MAKMMIGYIQKIDLNLNPQSTVRFKYKEAPYTQRISSRGNKIKCKIFQTSLDYDDVLQTTKIMKQQTKLIIVREPFFVDDDLRERVIRWVEWANNADPKQYDPFAS